MLYFQTKDKTLFSYDDGTGVTFIFKDGKWRFSETVYGILVQESVQKLSKKQVKQLTNGVSIKGILHQVRNVLDVTI